MANDVTERLKAEDVLRKTLKEISAYQYALDESSIVAITDQKGIIKHVNNNFCKISKYSEEELIGFCCIIAKGSSQYKRNRNQHYISFP